MKRYFDVSMLLFVLSFSIIACSKRAVVVNNNPPINGPGSNLFPFKAGNVWIYQDSLWDSTKAIAKMHTDTAYISSSTLNNSSVNGGLLYNFVDPHGVFGSCYFGTTADQNGNGYILESDSPYVKSYIFFGMSTSDRIIIDSWQDPSNASCTYSYAQYAYSTPTLINGYNCYKNIITTTNCNNINTENFVEYVSPGVGVVRLENWAHDTTGVNKPLYLQYSQTLQKFIPK